MKVIDEWNRLIGNIDNIYIYGAGKVATKITELLDYSGKKSSLKGYIVSSKAGNPHEINGIPVICVQDMRDKNVTILVSLSEVYHPEVFQKLEKEHFTSVAPAHKFFSVDIKSISKNTINMEYCVDKEVILTDDLFKYREKMINKYAEYNHAFGSDGFYQSSPTLGLKGTRDTSVRLKEYKLTEFITTDSKILDIGSNIGFLDMEISKYVRKITGLEYSDILAEIANETAEAMSISNVRFICTDYNEWQMNNTQTYDVIFSFAVHAWLNVKPDIYAMQIVGMLNENGYIVFESQQLSSDKLFADFVNALEEQGMEIIREGIFNDGEEETDRKFLVMKRR